MKKKYDKPTVFCYSIDVEGSICNSSAKIYIGDIYEKHGAYINDWTEITPIPEVREDL